MFRAGEASSPGPDAPRVHSLDDPFGEIYFDSECEEDLCCREEDLGDGWDKSGVSKAVSSGPELRESCDGVQKFMAASAFNGAITNYVFKLGRQGLGYYHDGRSSGSWLDQVYDTRVTPKRMVVPILSAFTGQRTLSTGMLLWLMAASCGYLFGILSLGPIFCRRLPEGGLPGAGRTRTKEGEAQCLL